jgi:Mg2+ and Co2+ transporter CorA
MMTAKEKRYVRNLEIKIEQLEAALKRSRETWADQFSEIYKTRTAMFQAFGAIEEAAVIMHDCIKDDPQYMAERKRIDVVPDF